jgi:hypothetical protein
MLEEHPNISLGLLRKQRIPENSNEPGKGG